LRAPTSAPWRQNRRAQSPVARAHAPRGAIIDVAASGRNPEIFGAPSLQTLRPGNLRLTQEAFELLAALNAEHCRLCANAVADATSGAASLPGKQSHSDTRRSGR